MLIYFLFILTTPDRNLKTHLYFSVRLGLPFTIIRHKNEALWNCSGNKRNLKMRPFPIRFSVDVSPRFSATWKSNEGIGINWKSTSSCLTLLNCTVLVTNVVNNCSGYGRAGKWYNLKKIGPTCSSLTMLLGGKSLKTIFIISYRLNLCLFCNGKVILMIIGGTFIILA